MRADFVNERCCNVFGTHAEELLGFGWLDFLDRADVEAAEIGLAQVIEELREVRLALRLHRPDGSVRHVELCAAPERSEEHTSELQSLMSISYAAFCLKKKNQHTKHIILSPLRYKSIN